MRPAVPQVVQLRRGRAAGQRLRDDVEILVVALDPVERRGRIEILAVVARHVPDRHPQRYVGVPRHDRAHRVERTVNVAERTYLHLSGGWRLDADMRGVDARGFPEPQPAASSPWSRPPTSAKSPPVPISPVC